MAIQINTEAVKTTAGQISSVNRGIADALTPVESAIRALNQNWDGTAADAGIRKFQDIKRSFCTNRYNAVNDMVNFMLKQVGEGYEATEQAITTAASAFK